jgi:hypothetical protein
MQLSCGQSPLDVLGRAQSATGDYAQAQTSFGRMVQLLPKSPLPYLRMASADPKLRMPNLATALPDPAGVELIRQWILHLGSCSQEAPP